MTLFKYFSTFLILSISTVYGYNRKEYGSWEVNKYTGCNTRQEILLTQFKTFKKKISKCKIDAIWVDFYTGKEINSWENTSIDHILPVSYFDAHCRKDKSLKEIKQFYNDRQNLVITTKKQNSIKGNKTKEEYSKYIKDLTIRQNYINKYEIIYKKYCE